MSDAISVLTSETICNFIFFRETHNGNKLFLHNGWQIEHEQNLSSGFVELNLCSSDNHYTTLPLDKQILKKLISQRNQM